MSSLLFVFGGAEHGREIKKMANFKLSKAEAMASIIWSYGGTTISEFHSKN